MSNILPGDNKILLASNTNEGVIGTPSTNNEWHEPFLEFAKDMLTPDWTDVVLLMATGPEGPAIKRAIKLPEAIKKFIESFAKYIDKVGVEGIEKSFELFIRTGDKKGLEESITALRKSGVKEKIQMADRMENGILKIEAKKQELQKANSHENRDKDGRENPMGTENIRDECREIRDTF